MALPRDATFKLTFTIVLLAISTMGANAQWINSVNEAKKTSVYLPPVLSSCLTPLSSSATTRWVKDFNHGRTSRNVSLFCNEGGLICDESIEIPSTQLHSFTTYRLEKKKDANLQFDNMFFKENLISVGNLVKLPMQEPHIPTRAFLPPLLEPQLFNHSTSMFLHVLQHFGFHEGTPLANSMQQTLQICNTPPSRGETKSCVATFEAMLDFAMSSIGTVDMTILVGVPLPPQQRVTVMDFHEVTWASERDTAVVCHNAMFPFQVFYCHQIQGTKVFRVTLQTTRNKMTNISAMASCHPFHTSPQIPPLASRSFQHKELLCHWNYGDNIVWIRKINLSSHFARNTKWSSPPMNNPSYIAKF